MSNDRPQDDRVSTTYRSLANERTPQHLDDKILQMAAANAQQPRYSRWMAWSRPLAWAATITLCLAITLELTREPSLEPGRSMPAEIAESAPATPPPLPDELRERETADALARSMASEKTALARSATMQPSANSMADAKEERAEVADSDVRFKTAGSATISASLESDQVASEPRAARQYAIEEVVVVDDCDNAVQSKPETWLECILALEEAGDDEAAERQREALIEVFPDFKLP